MADEGNVDAALRRLQSHPGVVGYLILNENGRLSVCHVQMDLITFTFIEVSTFSNPHILSAKFHGPLLLTI